MSVLRTEQLTVAVSGRTLCRDMDLQIHPGELWAVLGCNGSGKTTLLHTLAGLAPASGGRVLIGGQPPGAYAPRALGRLRGVLLQHETQEFWGSLHDYVMLGRYPHARALFGWEARDEQAAAEAIAAFDLAHIAAQSYVTLSGGERQRARLAQLWAQDAQLLLLDEPLQHLDLRHQLQVMERVRAVVDRDGRAALMVVHDPNFAVHCDRVLLLYDNGRHAAGSAAELLDTALLEELYGCRLRRSGIGRHSHFIPVI